MAVTGHTRHRPKPNPVSQVFECPDVPAGLYFGPTALAAGIARTATISGASATLLAALKSAVLLELQFLINPASRFELSPDFSFLADTQRKLFAARVGAGITDLLMNTLGYTWRDNASSLSSSLDPHADFIYEGGSSSGCGVVLAEAHGSFSNLTTAALMSRRAVGKYKRQVKPYIARNSCYGQVIHGYSVAFGARPGSSGGFLHVAETHIKKRSPTGITSKVLSTNANQPTQTAIALAAHRSNFSLMDAHVIVTAIDAVRQRSLDVGKIPKTRFLRFPDGPRIFLASTASLWPHQWRSSPWYMFEDYEIPDEWWSDRQGWHVWRSEIPQPFGGWFVMEEGACEKFLNNLSRMLTSGFNLDGLMELPTLSAIGFGNDDDVYEAGSERPCLGAQFRDGFAVLERLPPPHGLRVWYPNDGLSEPSGS